MRPIPNRGKQGHGADTTDGGGVGREFDGEKLRQQEVSRERQADDGRRQQDHGELRSQ